MRRSLLSLDPCLAPGLKPAGSCSVCWRSFDQVTSTLIPDRIARQFGLRRGFKEFVGTVAFLGGAFIPAQACCPNSAQCGVAASCLAEAWHVFEVV